MFDWPRQSSDFNLGTEERSRPGEETEGRNPQHRLRLAELQAKTSITYEERNSLVTFQDPSPHIHLFIPNPNVLSVQQTHSEDGVL